MKNLISPSTVELNHSQQPIAASQPGELGPEPAALELAAVVDQEVALLPPVLPADQPEGRWRARAGLRFATLGLTLLTLAGCEKPQLGHHDTVKATASATSQEAKPIPVPTLEKIPLPTSVQADVAAAISVDTCATKVTAAEVTSTYQRMFGYKLPTGLSKESMNALVTDQIAKLDTARQAGQFQPLPANFTQLEKDAMTDTNAIPVSEYQTVFDTYMKNMGVEVLYNWQPKDVTTPSMEGDIVHAKPLSAEQLASNTAIRRVLIGALRGYANQSPAYIRANIKQIVVGDDIAQSGDTTFGERINNADGTIVFDVADPAKSLGSKIGDYQAQIDVTGDHEEEHAIDAIECPVFLFPTNTDPAYESFNKSFTYSLQAAETLAAGNRVAGTYISLEDSQKKTDASATVVVARPYGGEVFYGEDEATLQGEDVIYSPNMDMLFLTKADTIPVKEKIALLIARAAVDHPDVAKFYALESAAARTQAVLNNTLEIVLFDKINNAIDAARQAGASDPTQAANVKAVIAEQNYYQDMQDRLTSAISGIPSK